MSNFTYEERDGTVSLETYEWDNVWWDHPSDTASCRVLYIGDSISCPTRRKATQLSGGTILFDGFGTSKALDNPYFYDAIRLFAKQQPKRDLILINNGLHGWHLEDETQYAAYYEKMLRFLTEEFSGTPISVVLTTHVADPDRDARVRVRNRAVSKLAEQYGLSTVDPYALTKDHDAWFTDGVHLCDEGYEALAQTLVAHVRSVLKK